MRIVAFGTYQADTHPRVRVLIEGLRAHGHQVIEINEPLGMSTAERVSMLRRPWTVPTVAMRLLVRWSRLARRGRSEVRHGRPDAVLVGYLGHFDVHLAARVFRGSLIVLDHMIFAAGTAIDRGAKKGVLTAILGIVDRRALAAADVIVLDTAEHQAKVPDRLAARSVVALVGADATWFDAGRAATPDPSPGEPVRLVFFGLYTPLQGAAVIGQALAKLAAGGLDARSVQVTMIGTGQDLLDAEAAAGSRPAVDWLGWVPPAELPAVVAAHHIALGIFGTTVKGSEVVPNKVYQSAAAGCAVITSDTAPQRRVLGESVDYVPAGDPEALAAAISLMVIDRERLALRRRLARELAVRTFAAREVVVPLLEKLSGVLTEEASTQRTSPATAISPHPALRWPLIKRYIRLTRPATTLEIGCGQGAMADRLVELTQSFTLVEPDFSSFEVARASIESRGGTVLNCTAHHLGTDRTFDMVCAFELLGHSEDDAAALGDWATRVRLGGHLMLSVPARQHGSSNSGDATRPRRYAPSELADKLRATGFEPVSIGRYGWPPAFLPEAVRNRVQPLVPRKGNGIVALARRVR